MCEVHRRHEPVLEATGAAVQRAPLRLGQRLGPRQQLDDCGGRVRARARAKARAMAGLGLRLRLGLGLTCSDVSGSQSRVT